MQYYLNSQPSGRTDAMMEIMKTTLQNGGNLLFIDGKSDKDFAISSRKSFIVKTKFTKRKQNKIKYQNIIFVGNTIIGYSKRRC